MSISGVDNLAGEVPGSRGKADKDFRKQTREANAYWRRVREGICTQCRKAKAEHGQVMCEPCHQKHGAAALARYYAQSLHRQCSGCLRVLKFDPANKAEELAIRCSLCQRETQWVKVAPEKVREAKKMWRVGKQGA